MKKILLILLSLVLLVGCSSKNNDKEYTHKASMLITDFLGASSNFSKTYHHVRTAGYDDAYNGLIDDTKKAYDGLSEKIKDMGDASDELKPLSEKIENTNKSIYKLINMIQDKKTIIIDIETEKANYDKLNSNYARLLELENE